MEFKYRECKPGTNEEYKLKLFEKTLKEGMDQIKEKNYFKKYLGSRKTIYQAAFAFLGRDLIEMIVEK